MAIRRLVDDHVRIINLSMGGDTGSYVLLDAVNYAIANGILLVASSGNNGSGQVEYPAAWLAGNNGAPGYGVAVGASDFSGNRASFSQWGSRLSLLAPGTSDGSNLQHRHLGRTLASLTRLRQRHRMRQDIHRPIRQPLRVCVGHVIFGAGSGRHCHARHRSPPSHSRSERGLGRQRKGGNRPDRMPGNNRQSPAAAHRCVIPGVGRG